MDLHVLVSFRNAKDRSCEWHSLDFSTDEPVKQHFRACFSSPQAAQEFAEKFTEVRGFLRLGCCICLCIDVTISVVLQVQISTFQPFCSVCAGSEASCGVWVWRVAASG